MKHPEIQNLLDAVEKKYGHKVATTKDFEMLSAIMQYEMRESLGASTLKRLWGYIPDNVTPRVSTLNILARYTGFDSFKSFCDSLHAEDASAWLETTMVSTENLSEGDTVHIGWLPNRLVKLRYKGNDLFEVLESSNARLATGDVFQAQCFFLGEPLFVPWILRDAKKTPPYVAGKNHGLTYLQSSR